MVNLKQLKITLESLGQKTDKVGVAIAALEELANDLESVSVTGRDAVDQMLGCMMGIEQILGKEDNKPGFRR